MEYSKERDNRCHSPEAMQEKIFLWRFGFSGLKAIAS